MRWTEAEYVAYLEAERHLFAWCLERYGGVSKEEAVKQALVRYPYQPAGTRLRGLIFHDQAWYWAMLHIKGQFYWMVNPELGRPSDEYDEESRGLSR